MGRSTSSSNQKGSGLHSLTVEDLVGQNQAIAALELAERQRNRRLAWILKQEQEQIPSPKFAEMQAFLRDDTAVVYWHLASESITTFLLTPHCPEPIVMVQGRDRRHQLNAWIQTWSHDYQNYRLTAKQNRDRRSEHPWRVALPARLASLRRLLDIATLEAKLPPVRQLILIPHHDLHRLPLHSLFASSLFSLRSTCTVTYLPSFYVGHALRDRAQPLPLEWRSLPLLNVEDPAHEGLADLPFAKIESTVIRQMFTQVTHIASRHATQIAVTEALHDAHQMFHFTGHGAYDALRPHQSALALTGRDRLTVEEISNLDLKHYVLISLAACETAVVGSHALQSDYVGLISSFLKAGANHVLSTLWTVDEISNAWLMIRFYQELQQNRCPARALQQAQTWLRSLTEAKLVEWLLALLPCVESEPGVYEYLSKYAGTIQKNPSRMGSPEIPYAHPYYWAAFILTGSVFL